MRRATKMKCSDGITLDHICKARGFLGIINGLRGRYLVADAKRY